MIKPLQPPWRAKGKQANRACGVREMHPYPRLRRYFPRRGKFWRRYASELCGTLFSTHSVPVRGKGGAVRHQRGRATAKTLHRVFESAKVGP
jgi:hypothetical protein